MARAMATRCSCPPESCFGKMIDALFESNQLQRGHHVITTLFSVQFSQQQRHFNVFKCVKTGIRLNVWNT